MDLTAEYAEVFAEDAERAELRPSSSILLLLIFLEFTCQRSTFAVNDIADPPAARSLDDDEGDRFLLSEIFKVRVNHRAAGFVARLGNREVFDLHVLSVVKRIAVDHTHLTL